LAALQDDRVPAISGYQEALTLWPQTARDKLTKVRLLRKLGETVIRRSAPRTTAHSAAALTQFSKRRVESRPAGL
jgi:hypothetical protein